MTSVQAFRQFITERLTTAAAEIFAVFEQTIVQYEEELDHQRRLLEVGWNPQNALHITELPQHDDCREEQLFEQETNYARDQEDPDLPQIKEEPEEPELGTCQEEERLTLKFGSDSFKVPSVHGQSYPSEREDVPDTEQFLSHDYGCLDDVPASENQAECEKLLFVETHGENVRKTSNLCQNLETLTDEKKIICELCGKSFSQQASLLVHMKSHAGEQPHPSVICGKSFGDHDNLLVHVRTHTGEKPYSCDFCGKSFSEHSHLLRHTRTHTGEKPHSCEICGKCFGVPYHLLRHMRTHTGEKPYSCEICAKCFNQRSTLVRHMRTHENKKS